MDRDKLAKVDYTLFFIIFVFACISYIAIYNAPINPVYAHSFAYRQIAWYIFGTVVAVLIMIMDYDRLRHMHWIFYGTGMGLLAGLVLAKYGFPIPFANEVNGSWGWYDIRFIGAIQPAEFMKLFLIVSLSVIIDKHNETHPVRGLSDDLLLIGKIVAISFPPLGLVLIQPDLGTALVIFSIVVAIIIISGINWKFIAAVLLMIAGAIAFFFISWFKFPFIIDLILEPHQKDRFYAWLDPYQYQNNEGFQVLSALNSIGSGEFFNTQLDPSITIPEAYNDFIFAVIGGTFGFVGACLVILLFFIMIYRITHSAVNTHDPFGTYLCTGVVGMLMFQVFENIGMTLLLMPVTGITLPFLSYGGSSLLVSLMSVGLVQSVKIRSEKFMFS